MEKLLETLALLLALAGSVAEEAAQQSSSSPSLQAAVECQIEETGSDTKNRFVAYVVAGESPLSGQYAFKAVSGSNRFALSGNLNLGENERARIANLTLRDGDMANTSLTIDGKIVPCSEK
ncbi:hypothetical protein [Roseibium album]|uniref:hypothetical protein n=1 Tax=Roseibium album TaxID=311410 RepID=UPI0032977040